MTDRHILRNSFLAENGLADQQLKIVAGDASNRKYFRLARAGSSAILMDAPPDKGEDVRPFVKIAQHLNSIGLSAPDIYGLDIENGFLLLEDFGDHLFALLLETDRSLEPQLYGAAIDVLSHLHTAPCPDLDRYSPAVMAKMGALAADWYHAGTGREGSGALSSEIESGLLARLEAIDTHPDVLVQRDYHAENLIWMPERSGVLRVGLLDFQDAMAGHPAYDLVSVLQDARRDVPTAIAQSMMSNFARRSGFDTNEFHTAYHLLGLQRNLRILGVFARLSMRDGKHGYLDLQSRVWGHIIHNVTQLEDRDLEQNIVGNLPAPDRDVLEAIRGWSV